MAENRTWLAPVLISVLLVGVPLAYGCGYFFTATRVHFWPNGPWAVRVYPSQWQADLFAPAAAIESTMRGREIRAVAEPGIQA